MIWQAWFTLFVVIALIVALVREVARTDILVLGALTAVLLAGVVTPEEAFSGFSNPAVITIGALYVVAAGIQRTGVLGVIDRFVTGADVRLPGLLLRLLTPVAFLSSFLNNTPVVAMLIPRVQAIAERTQIPVSKLLMPLSFATIAGGMTTLIGTSTNLIASGLVEDAGYRSFGLFEFAWIGLPATFFALGYLAFVGHRLLPAGKPTNGRATREARRYQFELKVPAASRLVGMNIAEAELRALQDAYLIHIERDSRVIGPASPDEVLHPGDVLTFSGETAAMDRLLQRPDLQRNVNGIPHVDPADGLPLFEAVVSAHSTLVGRTLRQVGFRDRYQGVVLAIHRRNEQLRGALGNIPLKPGDLLLIEARAGFDARWNQHADFYLVAPHRHARLLAPLSQKAPIAMLLVVAMIGLNVLGVLPLATAAIGAAMGMQVLGCLRSQQVRRAIDLPVMLTIAGAFGLGQAVETSGLAAVIASGISGVALGFGPLAVVAALYVATVILTEIVTNNAAVVLMIPIALVTAAQAGMDPHAVALVVTVAASASFISPLGYQTNLMVMGAGGYRVKDYFRAGLPLAVGIMLITMLVVYLKWL